MLDSGGGVMKSLPQKVMDEKQRFTFSSARLKSFISQKLVAPMFQG